MSGNVIFGTIFFSTISLIGNQQEASGKKHNSIVYRSEIVNCNLKKSTFNPIKYRTAVTEAMAMPLLDLNPISFETRPTMSRGT